MRWTLRRWCRSDGGAVSAARRTSTAPGSTRSPGPRRSAQTRSSGIFATSHVPTIHPLMAAKQAASIDHVTNGRFALNVVTGWHQPEMEMFGTRMLGHDERYEVASEWVELIVRLWTSEEPFDHEGKYFRLTDASISPLPVQKPHPVLMNAGGSKAGRAFSAKYCDVVFITPGPAVTPEDLSAAAAEFKRLARDDYGREIQVWTLAYVVQDDTEEQARRFYDYYVNEHGDWDGASNLIGSLGMNSETTPPDVLEATKEHFIAGWGGHLIIGTRDQVVDELDALSQTELDGILLNWPRYVEGMAQFQAETYPALVQAGLR